MNDGINYFQHFYQQASQNPDLLERNANDYPYSSLTGLLLLYHYKKTNHPGFEKLAKKTALHFKNANWLQFLLDQPFNGKTEAEIIPSHSGQKMTEVNEINSEGEAQILPGQNSGIEIEKVSENKISIPENIELPQQAEVNPMAIGAEASSAILPEPNFQKIPVEDDEITEPSAEKLSFEPLHTVDYFASQGIKIPEEPVATDKLGNQVKSFTAWLKGMKKLHPAKLEEQDVATEKLVQNSAEESNIDSEVLTEAMAEVLIKQDKKEKAIDMYNKLSLINPSKSAYFAAKIESIKSG